eukprot:50898_1
MAQLNELKQNDIVYLTISTSIGTNEVIFSPHTETMEDKKDVCVEMETNLIVFFGGDIQDCKANMARMGTFNDYGEFCLESTLKMLRFKFPTSNISQTYKRFSVFSNLIANTDDYGSSVPSYKNGKGCQHLVELLSHKQITGNNHKLHLIGFSKGVNVLNQLVYETDKRNKDKNMMQSIHSLFNNVESMYFLDGGNGNKPKTLPTDDAVIHNFIDNIIKERFAFHIYGTPRQWQDNYRPWIGKEKKYFVDVIKNYKSKHHKYTLHYNMYEDKLLDVSLVNNNVRAFTRTKNKGIYRHFELLRTFNVEKDKFLF